jgi:hypothetical protein
LRERTIGQEQLHRRYREYQREYDKRPEVKTKVLERSRTPENRAKQREYRQRPEVKAKQREHMRKYRERHKKSSLSAEDDLPDWVDHFLPGPNINPHDDPAYDEPYVKCESSYSCPDPARTGPFNFSGGYIGKITACRECWQAILEMYEEEYQEGIVQHVGTAWQNEWAAEDHTIDDLDDESLMIRMEDLAERMDAIVQRIGSYPDAERDPEYLRLVEQHTAYARVLARRHGFGAEGEDLEVCGNCKTTREERSVLPHRLSRGETKTTRKLGLCYDCDSCYDCCGLVCEPDDVRDDHGFEAEEFEYPHHDPDWLYEHHIVQGLSARKIAEMLDVPVNLITRRLHEFGLYVPGEYTADRRMTENELRRMRERRAEDDPTSTAVYIGPGNHLSVAEVIDSDHFVLIDSQPRTEYQGGEHEMKPWMQHYFMDQLMDMAKALDYELEDNQSRLNDQNAARMTFRTPSGQIIDYYYNSVYPFADGQEIPEVMESLSTADRLIIAGYHPVEQLLDDMPNLNLVYLYEHTQYPTEKNDHFDDFGNPTVIKGFFERGDESHPSALQFVIMGMDEDYESGNITDQYIEKGPFGGSGITWEYPEAAEQIERNYWRVIEERRYDSREAESDPVSSVAAGTTDALNDFANSQDTDDKFYFIGGLVGGLAIAVLGNIISDRLQDVYFPHWWENRGGSKS